MHENDRLMYFNGQTAQKACEMLLAKMAPVKEEMKDAPWEKLVAACYAKELQLTAQYQ